MGKSHSSAIISAVEIGEWKTSFHRCLVFRCPLDFASIMLSILTASLIYRWVITVPVVGTLAGVLLGLIINAPRFPGA